MQLPRSWGRLMMEMLPDMLLEPGTHFPWPLRQGSGITSAVVKVAR